MDDDKKKVGMPFLSVLCFREEVRNVPDQLLAYTRRKHYLHATELLNNSGMCCRLLPSGVCPVPVVIYMWLWSSCKAGGRVE